MPTKNVSFKDFTNFVTSCAALGRAQENNCRGTTAATGKVSYAAGRTLETLRPLSCPVKYLETCYYDYDNNITSGHDMILLGESELWPNQIWAVKAMDRRTYNRGIFRLLCLILECDLSCIIWILFDRTIRTFKLMPWRQFVQRITRDAVSAGEPHWWIGICRLLP